MQITPDNIMLGLAILGGAMGVISYFQKRYAPKEISDIRSEIEILKKQVGLFWGVVERQMSTLLHSPHRPTLDRLLEKNQAGHKLTDDEANQLVDLLQKLIDSDDLSRDEISWATMLLAVTTAKYGVQIE